MRNALVSVIVPVYNVEKYLDRCIQSIEDQSYKYLEIILVDDGSPDNCPEICDEWAKKDSRIVVIHKANGGLSDARNAGMNVATGEYISFIDSDDWIEHDFLELLLNEINDKNVDIAECAIRLCDDNNNTLRIKGAEKEQIYNTVNAVKNVVNDSNNSVTVWNKLYKREVISYILFEKGKYHEDTFWTWKVFLNANKVAVINKPLYNYVQRDNSIMGAKYSLKRLDSLEAAYEIYVTLKDSSDYSSLVKNNLVASCLYNLQCSYKYLSKTDLKVAKEVIFDYLNKSAITIKDKDISNTWFKLFLKYPFFVAKIRSVTGIGF